MSAFVGVASQEAYLCASARTFSTSPTSNCLTLAITTLPPLCFGVFWSSIEVWGGGNGRMSSPQTGTWEGELHFMTQAPKLAWLNNSTGWVEGQGNMSTGESSGKIYAKK